MEGRRAVLALAIFFVASTLIFTSASAISKTYKEEIDTIRANTPRHVDINEIDFHITEVVFVSNTTEVEECMPGFCDNVFKLIKIDYAPTPALSSQYRALEYYEISMPERISKNIISVDISFYISKSWLYKYDKSDIILMRLDKEWEELETELISEAPEVLNYRAKSPGLSFFAIVGKETIEEVAPQEPEPEPIKEEPIQVEETPSIYQEEAPIKEERSSESPNLYIYLFGGIIIVLIAAVGYFIFSRKKKAKE